ncbi:MAG: hypothetical protein ACHQVS_03720 [Candidatus Babeliales bacterium]
MKTINYYTILVLFLASGFICASEKSKKTSPHKEVTFAENPDAQEPLLARSVSSEGPPFEGAMRMQRMPPAQPILEEESDKEVEASSRRDLRVTVEPGTGEVPYGARITRSFTFKDSATGDALPVTTYARPSPSQRSGAGATLKNPINASAALSTMRSPRPSPRHSVAAVLTSPKSRRSSAGSQEDDPVIKLLVENRCNIAGKNTPETRKHFRKIVKEEQKAKPGDRLLASGNLQTIDGEEITDEQHVDFAALGAGSRGGSIASGGDVARDEWLQGDLSPNTLAYYRKLKFEVPKTEERLRSALRDTIKDSVKLNRTAKEKTRQALASLYHAHHRTKSSTLPMPTILSVQQDQHFADEIEKSFKVGCCAGCCSSCSPCCVIL